MTDTSQATSTGSELATLGGGCFWCLEAVFDQVKGVDRVESGYMGGERPIPLMRRFAPEQPDMPRSFRFDLIPM